MEASHSIRIIDIKHIQKEKRRYQPEKARDLMRERERERERATHTQKSGKLA